MDLASPSLAGHWQASNAHINFDVLMKLRLNLLDEDIDLE